MEKAVKFVSELCLAEHVIQFVPDNIVSGAFWIVFRFSAEEIEKIRVAPGNNKVLLP